jgi:DNA-directed RNA polymerase specialized sigma24 family protein
VELIGKPAALNQEMVAAVEAMLADGFIEGFTAKLRATYSVVAEHADAAVGHAVEKLITQPKSPRKPHEYLATCAHNEMKRRARHVSRLVSLDGLRDGDDEDRKQLERDVERGSVEEKALIEDVYGEVCRHVETWETGNVRLVTLLYLEAARLGEPLASDEAAERIAEITGQAPDSDFVRTWKSRGFKRLQKWVSEQIERERENDGS